MQYAIRHGTWYVFMCHVILCVLSCHVVSFVKIDMQHVICRNMQYEMTHDIFCHIMWHVDMWYEVCKYVLYQMQWYVICNVFQITYDIFIGANHNCFKIQRSLSLTLEVPFILHTSHTCLTFFDFILHTSRTFFKYLGRQPAQPPPPSPPP